MKTRTPEERRAYAKAWRASNPDKVRAANIKFKEKNPEACKALQKRWKQKHGNKYPELAKKYYREYYANHREQEIKRSQDWKKRNPEQARLQWRLRDARKRGAEGSFTAEDIKDLYATQGGRCYYCSIEIEKYHIEHMTPLSRGGRNDVSNICLACAPCNLKKHTKTAEEFM